MKTTNALMLSFALSLGTVTGCGTTPAPGGGGGPDQSVGGGGDLSMAMAGDMATVKDMATSGPQDASAAAMYFCQGYQAICGFGGELGYANLAACLAAYDSYSVSRETCVADALGAAAQDKNKCTAASGGAPCDK